MTEPLKIDQLSGRKVTIKWAAEGVMYYVATLDFDSLPEQMQADIREEFGEKDLDTTEVDDLHVYDENDHLEELELPDNISSFFAEERYVYAVDRAPAKWDVDITEGMTKRYVLRRVGTDEWLRDSRGGVVRFKSWTVAHARRDQLNERDGL